MTISDLQPRYYQALLSFLLLFIFSNNAVAQCAGSDTTVTVCNKDADVGTRTYDLFTDLAGSPTAGGTWSTANPANFFALNQTTGVVDLWRINNFGEHQFTYTNPLCGETATVTLLLGGYPGENNIDGSANACSDDANVNLHGFLGSEVAGKVQDFNGLWEEDPTTFTGQLEENIFNAEAAGPGIYIFTYTVESVDTCAERMSTVILEVHPSANPGMPTNFTICANEDFSSLTAFDLNDRLVDEDPNGTWSENGTNQLSDLNDSVINIEELNSTFGYGSYSFIYTVFPSHPVCEEMSATVTIDILPALSGEMTVTNFCLGSEYRVDLTYNDTLLHNGSFLLDYSINGTAATASASLTDGSGFFVIDPNIVPTNQMVSLSLTGISGVTPMRDVCPTILVPSTSFLVSNAISSVADICIETEALVTLSNILDSNGTATNGNFNLSYTLTNPQGRSSAMNRSNIPFTDGNASFVIDAINFENAGDYSIVLAVDNTLVIDCELSNTFVVRPRPSDISLALEVDNNCDATVVDVIVDAPILSTGTYTITYDVVALGTNTVLTTNTINFNGGTANYQIDVDALPEGNYTSRVRSTQNDAAPCRLIFDFELTENFARQGQPDIPVADSEQVFCLSDYPLGPTLADISVTANGDILFYATANDTEILAIDTPLVNGEDYFVSNTETVTSCEGSERLRIVTELSVPVAPTGSNLSPQFCTTDNPTLSDILVDVPVNSTVVWFDAAIEGNLLETATILANGQSYFAAALTNGGCTSTDRLEFTPMVTAVAPVNLNTNSLALCGLDNPTVLDLTDLENTTATNEILWYDQAAEGSPLEENTLLIDKGIYYAESLNPETGCTHPERIPVIVDLTSCVPEDNGFFIPDGFSPNGDGRNDTFYIPNIEVIFPDFTLEILNRYGNSLFKGDRNNPAWDGRNGSGTAPNGVYFYIIQYNKNELEPVQGRLYLNR